MRYGKFLFLFVFLALALSACNLWPAAPTTPTPTTDPCAGKARGVVVTTSSGPVTCDGEPLAPPAAPTAGTTPAPAPVAPVVATPAPAPSTGGPNVPTGIKAVGNKVLTPCTTGDEPKIQLEKLKENGKVVANAFRMLDLNEDEVTSGLRYVYAVPQGTYTHLFVAINDDDETMNDFTWEMHGKESAIAVATAATIWCRAGNYDTGKAGHARLMNAQNIPTALRDAWIKVGPRGVMPTSK